MDTKNEQKKIENYLKKRKKAAVTIAFLIASLLLVMVVIFPQFNAFQEARSQALAKEAQVKKLQNSYNTLSSKTEDSLNSQLSTVNSALPSNKNIIAVFTGISSVASKYSVNIDGFTIRVGGVYSKDPKNKDQEQLSVTGVPFLRVILNATAQDAESLVAFINGLYSSLPLAEVKVLNSKNNEATLEVNFYYKPYNLQALSGNDEITPLTPQEEKILRDLVKFSE